MAFIIFHIFPFIILLNGIFRSVFYQFLYWIFAHIYWFLSIKHTISHSSFQSVYHSRIQKFVHNFFQPPINQSFFFFFVVMFFSLLFQYFLSWVDLNVWTMPRLSFNWNFLWWPLHISECAHRNQKLTSVEFWFHLLPKKIT